MLVVEPLSAFVFRMQAKRTDFECILITGPNSGIGRELALAYAKPGVNLVLVARGSEVVKDVAADCVDKGATVKIINKVRSMQRAYGDTRPTAVRQDITDAEGMKSEIIEHDHLQPFDLVVANAGISSYTVHCFFGSVFLVASIAGAMARIRCLLDVIR